MKAIYKILALVMAIFLLNCPVWLYGQSKISGAILDKNGKLSGVTVTNKTNGDNTSTNQSGSFIITGKNGDILEIRSIGYVTQRVILKESEQLRIILEEDATSLDEVVVVGYGTEKRKDVTGAIASIDATKIRNEHPASVNDILRGNVAGLNIGLDPSADGNDGSILVRGKNTLNAGSTPLIILDGAIYSGSIASINPDDIKSVDVLKDGSAAAIYGSSSASGVIAITTKRGTTDKPTVDVNATTGLATMSVNQEVYSPEEFISFRQAVQESLHASSLTDRPGQYSNPFSLPEGVTLEQWLAYDSSTGDPNEVWLRRLGLQPVEITNYRDGNTTDWYNLSFKQGLRQDFNVSISGKSKDVNYYWAGNYQDNEGIVKGDRFKTFRNRLNLEAKVTSFLKFGMNTQFSFEDRSGTPLAWADLITQTPYASLYNTEGTDYSYLPVGNNNTFENELGVQKYTTTVDKTYALNSSIYGEINFPFGIKFRSTFTPNLHFNNTYKHQSSAWPSYSTINGAASRARTTTYQWLLDNVFSWEKTFADRHRFNITAGQTAQKYQTWYDIMDNSLFSPNDNLGYHNIGSGTNPIISSNDQYSTQAAYFGRVNYAYDDRYIVTATFRRDGNSAFGQQYPWANFPSIGLGWNFSNEKFFNIDGVDYGKLRLTYSQNGNGNIGRYIALSQLKGGQLLNVKPDGTVISDSQLYASNLPNINLQWEKTQSLNVGLDFSLMKAILSGSINLYSNKTTNLLALRSLPDVLGFENVWSNLGQVNNKGFEISLSSRNFNRENFSWNTAVNFALNRNKIVSLYGAADGQPEASDLTNGWFIDQDLNAVWDYRIVGVYQNNEVAEADKYNKQPGDFNLLDSNGDGVYTDTDKQFLGSTAPRFTWSMRNDFSIYKDFTFSFFIYSNWGQLAKYNQAKNYSQYIERFNFYKQPYWTPTNPINDYARIQSNDGGIAFNVWRKASFIRLDNISVGYTVPSRMIEKASIRHLKLFATVKNPFVWAPDWNYWDPQTNGPTPQIYTLGLNISL
ncbi:SusC/RagA family TonB-linked outer membrane protein [Sphingobacterium kitahiroshimense]|uniref:SusC/RagA family TonB-linked outer membrane protein n=1 Tax=Sphingobacterium kitahiroshimense TaxID=470446 RepID=UPI00320B67C1